jgi:UPF0716 protein FxsA
MSDWIGAWDTFLLILLSGFVGAYLAKREGIRVVQKIQAEMSQGGLPGREMIDGLCVLVGGVLLVTPGFFTDVVGLLFVLPFTRPLFRGLILVWIRKLLQNNKATFIYRR